MPVLAWSWRRLLAGVGGVLGIFVLGCATIIEGPDEDVSIRSTPTRAEVTVNGEEMGETPTTVTLEKKEDHTIEISETGYKTKTIQVSNEINVAWLVVDIFIGFVPVVVDAVTGAWYKLETTNIDVELEPSEAVDAGGPNYRVVVEGAERIAGPTMPHALSPAPYHPASAGK